MLHSLILKVTKFQLPPPKRLSTVTKNILASWPPCQIGLRKTMPFATAHLEIFHCTHRPLIPESDLKLSGLPQGNCSRHIGPSQNRGPTQYVLTSKFVLMKVILCLLDHYCILKSDCFPYIQFQSEDGEIVTFQETPICLKPIQKGCQFLDTSM